MLLRIKTILTNLYIIIYQYIKQLNNNSGFLANIINITVSGKLLNKKNDYKIGIYEWDSVMPFCLFFCEISCKEEKDIFLNEWYSFKKKNILTYYYT